MIGKHWKAWLWGWVAFSLLGSLLSGVAKLDPGPIQPVASVLTLGFMIFLACDRLWNDARCRLRALAVLSIGLVSELVGLFSGWPFGSYSYTSNWVPVLPLGGGAFFPLLLPFSWVMVVAACSLVVRGGSRWGRALQVGFLAMLVDLPMEWANVMALNYWKWSSPSEPIGALPFGVPILNSVGWFLVASVGGFVLSKAPETDSNAMIKGVHVLGAHVTLMIGLGIIGATFK